MIQPDKTFRNRVGRMTCNTENTRSTLTESCRKATFETLHQHSSKKCFFAIPNREKHTLRHRTIWFHLVCFWKWFYFQWSPSSSVNPLLLVQAYQMKATSNIGIQVTCKFHNWLAAIQLYPLLDQLTNGKIVQQFNMFNVQNFFERSILHCDVSLQAWISCLQLTSFLFLFLWKLRKCRPAPVNERIRCRTCLPCVCQVEDVMCSLILEEKTCIYNNYIYNYNSDL